MLTYEEQLNRDLNWAFMEGSLHFEQRSAVHTTLRYFAQQLQNHRIEYAVAGDLCMFFHGYRRFTQIVEILTTSAGLKRVFRGIDCRLASPLASQNAIRHAETGVEIKFLVSGEHRFGDGSKPVTFPHPSDVSKVIDGINFMDVVPLIELKFAIAAVTTTRRELADVQELIRYLHLPREFAANFEPHRHDLFRQLWAEARKSPLRTIIDMA
jgi:hypothetical protein